MDFPVTILRPNCPAIFASPPGSFAISAAQVWNYASTAAAALVNFAFAGVPVAGNLLVVAGGGQTATAPFSISDDMTDGGSWVLAAGPTSQINCDWTSYIWYKIVGAGANTNKTVTLTANSGTPRIEIFAVEYTAPGGTFSIDGTAVSGNTTGTNPQPTTPSGGAITTTTPNSIVVGYVVDDLGFATAGAGFVRQKTGSVYNFDSVEDNVASPSQGAITPAWVDPSSVHNICLGVGLKAT